MSTDAYYAKRQVFARLVEEAGGGGPLSALGAGGGRLQVLYDNKQTEIESRCIYGGPVEFEQDYEAGVQDGDSRVPLETVRLLWFILVEDESSVSIVELDQVVEEICVAVRRALAKDPYSIVVSGQGEYGVADGRNWSQLGFVIQTQAMIN